MGKTVYVGNISYDITDQRLAELFQAHGEVSDVRVVTDQYTGRSKGFAFVDMATERAAEAAISALNGLMMDGRQLRVAEARPRKPRAHDAYTYSDRRF
jgi:RNA recognition motif-containing protein